MICDNLPRCTEDNDIIRKHFHSVFSILTAEKISVNFQSKSLAYSDGKISKITIGDIYRKHETIFLKYIQIK